MPLWEALGMTALAAWLGYAFGRDHSVPPSPQRKLTAGSCSQCGSMDTDFFEFIDWGRSMRSLGVVRVKRGFCNSCFKNWDGARPHWDGFE
jgi:hypothetical protein